MNNVKPPKHLETLVVFETREEDVEGNLHLAKGSDEKFYLFYEGGTFSDGSDFLRFQLKSSALIRAMQLTAELLGCGETVEVTRNR